MHIEFDATFFAFVSLALFVGLLLWLKVPAMIGKALDTRGAEIAKELSEAKRLRDEAAALKAQYESRLAQAEADAKAMVSAAEEQAKSLANEARTQMQAEITRRQRQAEDNIARAQQQASAEVRAAAAEAAIAAAEKMLRGDLGADAHARLVDQGARELAGKFG